MTLYCALPEYALALMELWAFVLVVLCIANTVYAVFLKKCAYAVGGAASLVLACLVWQVAFDFHVQRLDGTLPGALTRRLVRLPWPGWALGLGLLTLAAAALFFRCRSYRARCISPVAVKLCADRMPCGICYWEKSGRVVLSNLCMNRLCAALTGQPLLNGDSLRQALPEGAVVLRGRAWRFTCREIRLDGEPLYEMIASDITREYARTRALERDAEGLSRMKGELQAYQAGIEESVRRQEILQAKINIHDEMNRLMLATVAAGGGKKSELDAVLSLWERNALLLCMEAEEGEKEAQEVEQVAQLLNLRLVWRSAPPAALTKGQRELFFSAAQEAVVNAVKHGEASELTVSFQETGAEIRCIFENSGKMPAGELHFTGGLANLALLAREQRALVTAQADSTFRLMLTFPRNS